MMDPILDSFTEMVESIGRRAPKIPFISNLTGTWITADQAQDPGYWRRHLRSTVHFARGLQELLRAPEAIFLEIGPGNTLQTLARQQPGQSPDQFMLASMRSPQEQQADVAFLLSAISQLWLHGAHINWKAFFAHEHRKRLELPTYPFERQSYWIGPAASSHEPALKKRDISNWFYRPCWKPAVADRAGHPQGAKGRWLLFCDGLSLGEEMAAQLRASGCDVTMVFPADRFVRTGPDAYGICADKAADYHAMCKEFCAGGNDPLVIAHLWSVTPAESSDTFDQLQRLGFYSLLYLAQALEKEAVKAQIQLAFISTHLQPVLGDEPLCPPKATALGCCKVLPQEYPNLRCRAIDVALEPHGESKLAEQLIHELTSEPFEAVAAYRKGRRWVQHFEVGPLAKVAKPRLIRDNGVYLITGGLGNIGLVVADSLARSATGLKLILTGRSAFPDRENWEQWISAQGPDDPVSRKIRRLLALEELGTRINVVSADSSDYDQMKLAIEQAEKVFGPINGVIHGAGNTSADGFRAASQVDRATAEGQFRPKIQGVVVLEKLLQGKSPDFCLMLSSISGVLGGLGLLPYASANLFLDTFAARQNQVGSVPWISVNWDAWQFPADEQAYRNSVPNWTEYILPSEGGDAFRRLLDGKPGNIAVSVTELQGRLDKWVKLQSLHETPIATSKPGSLHGRPNLSSQYVAPRTQTEQAVAAAWENLLGVAPIGVHDRFFELGGHSLLAIQLIAKIRETFQVEVPPQRVFEAPTVAQFAASIEADIKAAKEHQERQEEERMSELLDLVEGLSEEQVAEMLANPNQLAMGQAHG